MPVDYNTFHDDVITLNTANPAVVINFDTPNVDTSTAANLAFTLDPQAGGGTLQVSINGTVIGTRAFTSSTLRVVRENISGSRLSPNGNTLELTQVGGNGSLGVSDFMVLFKTP